MILLSSVRFGYGTHPVLEGVDLRIEPGQICGLLGRNAEGKTTLLKLVAGLRFTHSGSLSVFGADPGKRSPALLERMFFVPEAFELPDVAPQAYRDRYGGFYPGFSVEQFDSCLREFEVEPDQRLSRLSFGQRKKTLLAFAIATNCPLLLLDEPTNALDIPSKRQFRRVITSAMTDERIVIISTHQVRDLEQIIDPLAILHGGRIVMCESIAAIESRVMCDIQSDAPGEDVFYAESAIGGHAVVKRNTTGSPCPLNTELFFNAVTGRPGAAAELFSVGESK
jgi:ABC-2 type transport system ATP-binding protein